MTGALDLGHGYTSDTWPDQRFVAEAVNDAFITVRSREDFSARSSLRRMGQGTSDTALLRVESVAIARDIIRSLSDIEFGRLMDRVRKQRNAA